MENTLYKVAGGAIDVFIAAVATLLALVVFYPLSRLARLFAPVPRNRA